MKSRLIEAQSQHTFWGKFLLGQFDEQDLRHLSLITGTPLLAECGYGGDVKTWLIILDLTTSEGAIFAVLQRGIVKRDLSKHPISVSPLFEPFLKWLYENYNGDLDALPDCLELEIDSPAA